MQQFEKTTFYLTPEQVEKWDDLAYDQKKHSGQHINRNDIVRYLIDQATLDSLEGIKLHTKKQKWINVDSSMVSHPYSIYIWRPPHSPRDEGRWDEPLQMYTEQWALYIANLMHQDSHAVIKVVR